MEKFEKPEHYRDPLNNELESHESNSELLKDKIIEQLRKCGYTEEVQIHLNEWLEMKGVNKFINNDDFHNYAKLMIEQIEIFITVKMKQDAEEYFENLMASAKNDPRYDLNELYDLEYRISEMED